MRSGDFSELLTDPDCAGVLRRAGADLRQHSAVLQSPRDTWQSPRSVHERPGPIDHRPGRVQHHQLAVPAADQSGVFHNFTATSGRPTTTNYYVQKVNDHALRQTPVQLQFDLSQPDQDPGRLPTFSRTVGRPGFVSAGVSLTVLPTATRLHLQSECAESLQRRLHAFFCPEQKLHQRDKPDDSRNAGKCDAKSRAAVNRIPAGRRSGDVA